MVFHNNSLLLRSLKLTDSLCNILFCINITIDIVTPPPWRSYIVNETCPPLKGNTFRSLAREASSLSFMQSGRTVDLVVQEKVNDSSLRVKEVTKRTWGLCGGTFVDMAFKNHLNGKSSCFEKFSVEFPILVLKIQGGWEKFKYHYLMATTRTHTT